jgi:hypothetical protein
MSALIGILLMLCIAVSLFAPALASAAEQPRPSKCDGGFFSMSTLKPSCWVPSIVGVVSAGLIYISTWVLTISGILFNTLVDHTIVDFSKFLYSDPVRIAVETAWTAFRDISNIVIIGMFVFVAISIILGSDTFGQRKLVAKIIVIAVLINFSLLFTKIIIDFSNFAALQFHNAAQFQAGTQSATSGGSAATSQFAQKGIAGAFINYMGVTGFSNSKEAIKRVAEANDSSAIALLHGIVSSIFLLAAAVVLFYGSFLLASRGILLIFLLLTSSIAFATYLIPISVVNSKFGWSAWWSALLKSAVFAPLLMIFLWISLAVGQALKAQTGTLGDLMSNPTKGANMEALFSYIIVLGLLFISFKIASSFSTGIAGFNYAAMLPAGIAGAGAQLLGGAARHTVGRLGYMAGEALQAQAKDPGRSLRSRELFDFAAKPFKAVAKQDFNALRNTVGSAIADTAKMKRDTLTGGSKPIGGFVGERDKMLQKDAERYARMGINSQKDLEAARQVGKAAGAASKPLVERPPLMEKPISADKTAADKLKDKEAVRAEAVKEYMTAHPEKKKEHDAAKTEVKLSKDDLDALKRQKSDEIGGLVQSLKGLREQETTLRSNKADTVAIARADEIAKEISRSKVELGRAMKERTDQIKEATKKSQVADDNLKEIERKAIEAMQDRERQKMERNTKQQETAASTETGMRTFSETLKKTTEAFKKAGSLKQYEEDVFKKMKSQAKEKKIKNNPTYKAAVDAAKKEAQSAAAPPTPPASSDDKH